METATTVLKVAVIRVILAGLKATPKGSTAIKVTEKLITGQSYLAKHEKDVLVV